MGEGQVDSLLFQSQTYLLEAICQFSESVG